MPMSSSYTNQIIDKDIIIIEGPLLSLSCLLLEETLNNLHQYSFSCAMDWSNWLSKSSLHPSLAHEYGLLFSSNELEEDDIKHLDHEFLVSMGISVGKHRLEILKLARKERKGITFAVKKLAKHVSNYVQMKIHSGSSAIVVVPKAADRRRRTSAAASNTRLLITNGSPAVHDVSKNGRGVDAEVRWETMFQDLNPT